MKPARPTSLPLLWKHVRNVRNTRSDHLPEWFEKLDKLDEAHCAVRNHEILKAFETAFTPAVPRSAAPCPAGPKEKETYIRWDGKNKVLDVSGVKRAPLQSFFTYPGWDLAFPERIGEDCGRVGLDPAMLEEEEEEEEEDSNPGLLLDVRESDPGMLSSVEPKSVECE